jgi:hypothetical protein
VGAASRRHGARIPTVRRRAYPSVASSAIKLNELEYIASYVAVSVSPCGVAKGRHLHRRIFGSMLTHMRTSVDIPEPLLKRAKRLARERSTTLRQLLLDGLRSVVERGDEPAPYRMQDYSYGSGGLVEGLSWSDTERIDELIYEDRA